MGDLSVGRTISDDEHLRLLSIFHYVTGGLTGACSCFPVIHLVAGIGLVSGTFADGRNGSSLAFVGWLFIAIASTIIVLGWSIAIAMLFVGRSLRCRRNYTFCLVVAGLSCLNLPLGTILGIFTIVVLMRPSVKATFEAKPTGLDRELA